MFELDGRKVALSIAREIGERKRAEARAAELREINERLLLTSLAEGALPHGLPGGPLGMAIVGLDYRFADVNARLCHLLGYQAKEAHGADPRRRYPPGRPGRDG